MRYNVCFLNKFLYSIACILWCAYSSFAQDIDHDKLTVSKNVASDALFFDAVKAKMLGEYKQQEALLQKFIKERPEVAAAYYDLAEIELATNKTEEAEKNIQKAIHLKEENEWYKETYANILRIQRKYREAGDVYKELAQTSDYNDEAYYNAAMNYEKARMFKEALAMLDKMLSSSFKTDFVLQKKEEIYLEMNDLDGAIKIAQELIERNPKEGFYLDNLARLYLNNGKSQKALEIYKEGIRKFPNEPALQKGLADYYQKNKDTARYDDYAIQTILNPELDETSQALLLQQYLGEVEGDSLRKGKAIVVAQKLLEQQPNSPLMQAFYGQILARNNQPDEAAKYLKMALENDPSKFELWQELLLVYVTANNPDSLVASGNKALDYFPNNAMIHYFTGLGYLNQKKFTNAVKSLNAAIEFQPEDNTLLLADMYSSLGDAYNFLKEYTRSDSAYEKSLHINKDNPSVLNNYSYYLSLRDTRLEEAEKMSKRSLELRPGEATFLDTYGWVLYKQGKYTDAKKYIEEALKVNPNADGTLYDHLGDIHYKLKEVEKAVENWKLAKEKGTDNTFIDKKIQEKKLYE